MATQTITYRQIMSDLGNGKYSPIYYLMGEEPFYIDSIADYIREHAIPEQDRDFNQLVVYGNEISMKDVIARAKSFPMGAEKQVIIVKEAQNLMKKDSDNTADSRNSATASAADMLSAYLKSPQMSTILVFCHKNSTLDRRRKVTSDIEKAGILFESKKIREDTLPGFIDDYLSALGKTMSLKAESMMTEYVGADLSRMAGELTKLATAMPADIAEISPEFIENHVGISKDFNLYEFRNAIIRRDIFKANQIANYYESNAKTYPIQLVTATLFSYFSNLMLSYYAPDKSERGISEQLDMKYSFGVRDYILGMKNYTAMKTMQIITAIRRTDAKSKGIDATANGNNGLLRELLFFILH